MSHPEGKSSARCNLLLALALAVVLPAAAVATTTASAEPPSRPSRPTADSLPLDQVAEWESPPVDVGMLRG